MCVKTCPLIFFLGTDYTDFTDLVHDFVYTKTVLIRVIRA